MNKESKILVSPEQQEAERKEMEQQAQVAQQAQPSQPEQAPLAGDEPRQPPLTQPRLVPETGIEGQLAPTPIIAEDPIPVLSPEEQKFLEGQLEVMQANLEDGMTARIQENEIIIVGPDGQQVGAVKKSPELLPTWILESAVAMKVQIRNVRSLAHYLSLLQKMTGSQDPELLGAIKVMRQTCEEMGVPPEYWEYLNFCFQCPHIQDGVSCVRCPEKDEFGKKISGGLLIAKPRKAGDVLLSTGGIPPGTPSLGGGVNPGNGNKERRRRPRRRKRR